MKREHAYGLIIAGGVVSLGVLIWVYVIPHGPRQKTADELRRELVEGESAAVRAAAADALGAMGDSQSMPQLLAAMEDANAAVRGRAGVAVQRILGADFFFRANDPPEKREDTLQRIRNHWDAWQAKASEQSPTEVQ
jgi:HEAT repeat protein